MVNDEIKSLHEQLDALLGNVDLSDVSADSSGFSELPDGYYLCEVDKAELKMSKTSGKPMAAFQFSIVEDGKGIDESGKFVNLKKTKGRKIFIHYVLKDESWVRRFATDMLKFEGENPGEPLLPKEAFTTSSTIEDALDVLTGMRIYIQVSTTENDDGTKSTWNNLISWKRVAALELPQ